MNEYFTSDPDKNSQDRSEIEGSIEDLEQVDKTTGIFTDPSTGDRWLPIGFFCKKFNVDGTTVHRHLSDYKRNFRDKKGDGRVVLFQESTGSEVLARFISLPRINSETGIYEEQTTGQQSSDRYYFQKRFGVDKTTVESFIKDLGIKPIAGRNKVGQEASLYPLDPLVKELEAFVRRPRVDKKTNRYIDQSTGRSWVSRASLKGEYAGKASLTLIMRLIRKLTLLPGRDVLGHRASLIDENEAKAIINEYLALPVVRDGRCVDTNGIPSISLPQLAKDFDLHNHTVEHILMQLKPGKARYSRRETKIYPEIEAVKLLNENAKFHAINPITRLYEDGQGKQWAHIPYLLEKSAELPGSKIRDRGVIERLLRSHNIESVSGKGLSRTVVDLFSLQDALKIIAEYKKRPQVDESTGVFIDDQGEQWAVARYFARELFPPETRAIYDQVDRVKKTLPGRDKSGHPTTLYNVKEAIEVIQNSGVLKKRERRKQLGDVLKWEEQLRLDLERIHQETSVERKEFQKLIGFFGASRAADILFAHHPEYRGLPVEQVRSMLAEYLGDFLATRAPLNLDSLSLAAQYLTEPDWERDLYETLKADCFERHQNGPRSDRNNFSIIQAYIEEARTKAASADSEKLNAIIEQVYEYYSSIFQDQLNIPGVVSTLKVGREFPDYNQRINVKEIKEKKRMLLADEMGLGKSASAILAKEHLGLGTALVVVPANVLNMGTWQGYLSDNREGGGYFEEGMAPRIFVVESIASLQNLDPSEYDYILISHERLAEEEYVEYLEGMGFDMLIVDEVHKFKNIKKGIRAESLMRLAASMDQKTSYLALLSGTPIPNKVGDIAITLKLLYPEEFREMDNDELVHRIVNGEVLNLRSLLVARMQMKGLAESIEMPPLMERQVDVALSQIEHDVYEVLLEEDELNSLQKIHLLRQFLLNPELVDATPGLPSAKIDALDQFLSDALSEHDKVVVFVNEYVEGVIRGEHSIIDQLHIPAGVEVRTIEGDISKEKRIAIQKELNESGKRMVLFVSGKTADVGVDFSGADIAYFYNEPWTKYDLLQQRGRIYREGLRHALEVYTSITGGTIEEGIHAYIEAKQKAVEKLLRGIPLSELEKGLLLAEEDREPDLEVNPELAEYYFSSWDKLMKIFGYVKEIGEGEFRKFLETYGREYADCYTELGSRSYQANGSRIVGTLIDEFARARGQSTDTIRILDLASGPEMLKSHIRQEYQNRVFSMDLNRFHFEKLGTHRAVGSMAQLPFARASMDYVNLSLALHYTKFSPGSGDLERLEVLTEINRVLKPGGRAVINLIYSLDLRDMEQFQHVANTLGFRVVDEYSGKIAEGRNYQSHLITLEKEKELPIEEGTGVIDHWALLDAIGVENRNGLRFAKQDDRLKDARRILQSFTLGDRKHDIILNPDDQRVLAEEQRVLADAEALKQRYGGIQGIPKDEIIDSGFVRILVETKYILFKKLEQGRGIVVVKD